jgi:hypothetical protein
LVWLPLFADCSWEDCSVLHCPTCSSFFVFILITIPLVPRVKFCPLQYCPTCHSKAAWKQGLPLLGVHVFFFISYPPP